MLRPTATEVTPLDNYMLKLLFDDGETKIFDVKPYIRGNWFEQLGNGGHKGDQRERQDRHDQDSQPGSRFVQVFRFPAAVLLRFGAAQRLHAAKAELQIAHCINSFPTLRILRGIQHKMPCAGKLF